MGLLMLAAAFAAWLLKPASRATDLPPLAQVVPTHFGQWRLVATSAAEIIDPSVAPSAEATTDHPYSDVLMRTYANARGDVVLLALAYTAQQRQEVKIHRPELCYVAQGFQVLASERQAFAIPDGDRREFGGARLLVHAANRTEAVSYWIRIGSSYSDSAWATRYYLFREAIKGHFLDGILVRASQIVPDGESVSTPLYALQESFLAELVNAVSLKERRLLVGGET
jgi:EpsI family protein